ncbi:helix-turn-helix domain-containing protein [Bradyrhizobium sp. HKCCYLS3077]|uniref:helix-turn-helix domain-containing protein n=1 Tax=Bradyrhizobium sp. HKCCYLS3077 TaxID=3420761 RepID=UPI003EC0C5DB
MRRQPLAADQPSAGDVGFEGIDDAHEQRTLPFGKCREPIHAILQIVFDCMLTLMNCMDQSSLSPTEARMGNLVSQARPADLTKRPSSELGESPADRPAPAFGLARIPAERRWREPPPSPLLANGSPPRLSISMWSGSVSNGALDVQTDLVDAPYAVSYAMRPTTMSLTVGGRLLIDGDIVPGTTVLTGPALPNARATYRADYAIVRVFVSQRAVADCFEEINGRPAADALELFDPHQTDDRVLRHLVSSLIRAFTEDAAPSQLFLDSLSISFAAHLIGRYHLKQPIVPKRKLSPLTPWRLNRAKAFVDAHLDQPIALADLSAAAGLSRMHFAAQFKAATGLSPHMYLLQCRVHASKRLLLDPERSVRDVALAVGFKSETHFINVFRRLVGEAPGRWRRSIL